MKKVLVLLSLAVLAGCNVPLSDNNRIDLVAAEKCKSLGGKFINKYEYPPFIYDQYECFDETNTYFRVTSESIREEIGTAHFRRNTLRISR